MTRETPEYIVLNEDFSVTVKLSRPHSVDGQDRDTIVLREPTADEQAAFQTPADASMKAAAEAEKKLFAALANGVPPKEIGSLPLRDYRRLQVGFSFFVD